MPEKILITGGVRSGKTAYALSLCSEFASKLYIATAAVIDDEMELKVKNHKLERDESWSTFEHQTDIFDALRQPNADIVLIDCLTTWVSNLMYHEKKIEEYFQELIKSTNLCPVPVVIVTNEVGFGVIGADSYTRKYVNLLGDINKMAAAAADRVFLIASGIPVLIKGE